MEKRKSAIKGKKKGRKVGGTIKEYKNHPQDIYHLFEFLFQNLPQPGANDDLLGTYESQIEAETRKICTKAIPEDLSTLLSGENLFELLYLRVNQLTKLKSIEANKRLQKLKELKWEKIKEFFEKLSTKHKMISQIVKTIIKEMNLTLQGKDKLFERNVELISAMEEDTTSPKIKFVNDFKAQSDAAKKTVEVIENMLETKHGKDLVVQAFHNITKPDQLKIQCVKKLVKTMIPKNIILITTLTGFCGVAATKNIAIPETIWQNDDHDIQVLLLMIVLLHNMSHAFNIRYNCPDDIKESGEFVLEKIFCKDFEKKVMTFDAQSLSEIAKFSQWDSKDAFINLYDALEKRNVLEKLDLAREVITISDDSDLDMKSEFSQDLKEEDEEEDDNLSEDLKEEEEGYLNEDLKKDEENFRQYLKKEEDSFNQILKEEDDVKKEEYSSQNVKEEEDF